MIPTRRQFLSRGTAATAVTASVAGCLGSIKSTLGLVTYDTVTIEVEGLVTWTGRAEFGDNEGNTVQVPMRGVGPAEYTLPDDLRQNSDLSKISTPIEVSLSPGEEATDENPLQLTVRGDGSKLGSDAATAASETATVKKG